MPLKHACLPFHHGRTAKRGAPGSDASWSLLDLSTNCGGCLREASAKARSPLKKTGRGGRVRTCDLMYPKHARYQAAPRPERFRCYRGRDATPDDRAPDGLYTSLGMLHHLDIMTMSIITMRCDRTVPQLPYRIHE